MEKGSAGGEVCPVAATPTLAVPVFTSRLAGTAADNCVALTNVVASGLLFQVTRVLEVKPEPLAINVNPALPAAALFGEMVVNVRPGVVMVNGRSFES